mmetsp:Transcript_118211/g.229860  ORF Transcript_118211/g.229860 Transcript_118211/m.229860 type:complete len:479 (+) Transcript_118211:170-1606(+)|eukprot:CAMPEP_0172726852 /NCGR_PEP_ID=MMETSP1074-20121228/91347_1 /TAXON_ID=2916 /ORGANISM="Ceratium fusus, Strain PA161109" /LENGTH=478 /DNA_ID=CAMNT_0013553951 /DNA_START=159 /DNA_END=1595 /DNA_ORIENTATION=+
MSVDYQNSILWRGEDPVKRKFKPSYDGSKKTARYWPGKAPSWSQQEELEKSEAPPERSGYSRSKWEKDAVVLEDVASSRLKRLTSNRSTETGSERLLRHRSTHEASVLEASVEEQDAQKEEITKLEEGELKQEDADVETTGPVAELAHDEISGDDADDNELRAFRRERAREIALMRRKEEEEELLKKEFLKDEQDDEDGPIIDEEESEEESDSDSDEPGRGALLKPVFVSRGQRDTVREKETQKNEELEAEKRRQDKKKEKKVESKSLLIDEVRREEEAEREGQNENNNSDIELIDDNDEINEAEEYELWKIRELKRIKRDKEERLERQREVDFILRRRAMTEEERLADDKRLDGNSSKREEVKQFGFLQKYYHRGGFFQDKAASGEEPIYLRDVHEPLDSEKFDKQLLPSAMQLRRGQFGKMGQVKHTHLTEVDTTDFQAAWAQNNRQVQRYQERMATAGGVNSFERPAVGSASSAR